MSRASGTTWGSRSNCTTPSLSRAYVTQIFSPARSRKNARASASVMVERLWTLLSQWVQLLTFEERSNPIASRSMGQGPVIGSLELSIVRLGTDQRAVGSTRPHLFWRARHGTPIRYREGR